MNRFDLGCDENGSIIFKDSDVSWVQSDEQHIQDTINAFPGWWMENFSDGVGIRFYLNSQGQEQILARAIKIQLESDLYQVGSPMVLFDNGKLVIQPDAN